MKKEKQKAILIDLIHPQMRAEDSVERLRELEELVDTYAVWLLLKNISGVLLHIRALL